MGFAIPLTSWLHGPLRDWAEALLPTEDRCGDGLVNRHASRELWTAFLAGRDGLTGPLWSLLMFQAWLEAERSASAVPRLSISRP